VRARSNTFLDSSLSGKAIWRQLRILLGGIGVFQDQSDYPSIKHAGIGALGAHRLPKQTCSTRFIGLPYPRIGNWDSDSDSLAARGLEKTFRWSGNSTPHPPDSWYWVSARPSMIPVTTSSATTHRRLPFPGFHSEVSRSPISREIRL
jgi:hypothetical protein